MSLISNLSIQSQRTLITPETLLRELPLSAFAANKITESRQIIDNIIKGNDPRVLAIVGPCSIHDSTAALEYAHLLKQAATRFADELFIVMRVYFEKPRTTVGWKGLISDPFLDGSFDVNQGLKLARKLLLDLAELNLPTGTEFLDTSIPQFLSDLIAWGCIGARTSESQVHRELASGLPMPVGFKNTTDGNFKVAIDAVNVARHPHYFLSINQQGIPCIINTKGNDSCHIILRGSTAKPNYSTHYIQKATASLRKAQLIPRLMIDCSHGNSMKDHFRQHDVMNSIIADLQKSKICGIMLESNLIEGKQTLQPNRPLNYGQSITDACLSWEQTLPLLENLANAWRKLK